MTFNHPLPSLKRRGDGNPAPPYQESVEKSPLLTKEGVRGWLKLQMALI
jgi:hypothetical protein